MPTFLRYCLLLAFGIQLASAAVVTLYYVSDATPRTTSRPLPHGFSDNIGFTEIVSAIGTAKGEAVTTYEDKLVVQTAARVYTDATTTITYIASALPTTQVYTFVQGASTYQLRNPPAVAGQPGLVNILGHDLNCMLNISEGSGVCVDKVEVPMVFMEVTTTYTTTYSGKLVPFRTLDANGAAATEPAKTGDASPINRGWKSLSLAMGCFLGVIFSTLW